MKFLIVALCLAVAVLAEDKYQDIDENFNLSEVLNNDRLLNSYAKCLLNKGPCTSEVKQVKDKLREALETHCAKCTEKQKQMAKQLAREIKKKHPNLWSELVEMYDPEGKYQESFKEFLTE